MLYTTMYVIVLFRSIDIDWFCMWRWMLLKSMYYFIEDEEKKRERWDEKRVKKDLSIDTNQEVFILSVEKGPSDFFAYHSNHTPQY